MHLARNDESVWDVYVNSLEYDKNWLPVIAPKLKSVLDQSKKLRIISGDAQLEVNGKLEDAKLNIGDYTGMINIGGTFPIGEVFTEAEDFSAMNGSFYVYAYADKNFNVQMHEPFMVTINNGLIISCADNTPADFLDMIELVKSYERPLIRELGFGLNKAITKERFLSDITAFERILGLHFSLGEKHSVYKKDGITTNKTKFHIDIFPVVDEVYADDVLIFKDGRYLV
jgi:leucyl aminopeptidase (aminopeptidase T)